MPARRRQSTTTTLVLSDTPDRRQLRGLQSALAERRDRIASLDLEIETLRAELAAFESRMNAQLAGENDALRRVGALVDHLERWADTLHTAERDAIGKRGRRLDTRRRRELDERAERAGPDDEEEPEEEAFLFVPDDRLKAAYRALARRFHPDLARTEEERLRFGQLMTRINDLYRAADLLRLEAMAEQAKGGEVEDPDLPVDAQVDELRERLSWFDAVLDNLRDEREELERSSTCELWRNAQQSETLGEDLVADLRRQLARRVEQAYADIPEAIRRLEVEVSQYNRNQTTAPTVRRGRKKAALERRFDPYANKKLVRLSLDALATLRVGRAAERLAEWVQSDALERPALLRLLLFTYVAEMSPFPLAGLESFDDLRLRFDHAGGNDETGASLEATLVELDDLVEFGVRRATERVAHLGLRFRDPTLREAVPLALRALAVRRHFKAILAVLGERTACSGCAQDVFTIPLYRTRGLDDLRANVCPACGHAAQSYWMPRGKDVQAVLNNAYLDFELVTEWSFRLGRTSVALQLLPIQVEEMSVGQLKKRLLDDLLNRYELGLGARQVQLFQRRKRVTERTSLATLENRSLSVRFTEQADLTVADAVELLRHRIRNRFQPDANRA